MNIVVVEFLAFRIRGSRGKALNLVASPSELLGWVLCPVDFLLKLFQGQLLRRPLSVLDSLLLLPFPPQIRPTPNRQTAGVAVVLSSWWEYSLLKLLVRCFTPAEERGGERHVLTFVAGPTIGISRAHREQLLMP